MRSMGVVANRCIKETYSRVPIVELNPDPDYWTEIVEDGIKTLGPGFDVSAEVFASKAAPSGPISAMKITTVSPPPSGVRPTPTSWSPHLRTAHGVFMEHLPAEHVCRTHTVCVVPMEQSTTLLLLVVPILVRTPQHQVQPSHGRSTMGADPTTTKDDPPVKPYKTGTCSMHIFESAAGGDIGLPEDGSHDQGWRW